MRSSMGRTYRKRESTKKADAPLPLVRVGGSNLGIFIPKSMVAPSNPRLETRKKIQETYTKKIPQRPKNKKAKDDSLEWWAEQAVLLGLDLSALGITTGPPSASVSERRALTERASRAHSSTGSLYSDRQHRPSMSLTASSQLPPSFRKDSVMMASVPMSGSELQQRRQSVPASMVQVQSPGSRSVTFSSRMIPTLQRQDSAPAYFHHFQHRGSLPSLESRRLSTVSEVPALAVPTDVSAVYGVRPVSVSRMSPLRENPKYLDSIRIPRRIRRKEAEDSDDDEIENKNSADNTLTEEIGLDETDWRGMVGKRPNMRHFMRALKKFSERSTVPP